MPTFFQYTDSSGNINLFDDNFVPADIFRDGNLWSWGNNGNGQLGVNDTNSRSTPVTTFSGGTNWKQVSTGSNHAAVIKTDGSLWVWGANFYGQLGVNDTTQRNTPVTTFSGGTNWKYVSCGYNNITAIKTDGSLWVWGYNNYAQLGINDTTNRLTPVTTFAGGNNWKTSFSYKTFLYPGYTGAIKTDGSLWVWGRNDYAQLGVNDTTNRSTPVTTFAGGNDWKQVSGGGLYAAAIKTDGSLWTWGTGYGGQLGINQVNSTRTTPVTTFSGGSNWKQVSSGYYHTSAIKTDGSLWVWGGNPYAQLGTNDTNNRLTPVTTFSGGNNWKQISCGTYHTAAIKTDGSLWTWGAGGNNLGQLGTNDTNGRSTPVTIFAGGTNWKQVSSGSQHTAALTYIDYYQ